MNLKLLSQREIRSSSMRVTCLTLHPLFPPLQAGVLTLVTERTSSCFHRTRLRATVRWSPRNTPSRLPGGRPRGQPTRVRAQRFLGRPPPFMAAGRPGFCSQEPGAGVSTCCRPQRTRRPGGCRPQSGALLATGVRDDPGLPSRTTSEVSGRPTPDCRPGVRLRAPLSGFVDTFGPC